MAKEPVKKNLVKTGFHYRKAPKAKRIKRRALNVRPISININPYIQAKCTNFKCIPDLYLISEMTTGAKLLHSFNEAVDFNIQNNLKVPTPFSKAGFNTIHEGSTYFGGLFPDMYINPASDLRQIPAYQKLKEKIIELATAEIPGLYQDFDPAHEAKFVLRDEAALLVLDYTAQIIGQAAAKTKDQWFKVLPTILGKAAENDFIIKLSDFFDKNGKLHGDCRVVNTMIPSLAADLGVDADKMFLLYTKDPVVSGAFSSAHLSILYAVEGESQPILIDGYYGQLHKTKLQFTEKYYLFENGNMKNRRGHERNVYSPSDPDYPIEKE